MKNDTEKGSILIIDDDPLNLDMLSDYLQASGFMVLTAEGGEKAIKQINLLIWSF